MPSPLADPVKLPCGLVLPNRLSKAAMAEMIAKTNQPTNTLVDAYEQWSDGGWGSILTGNVQVDVNHMGSPFDPALHNEYKDSETNSALVAQWKKYADACQKHGTPAIAQICHPGRQSFRVAGHRGMFAQTLAPSAVPMKVGDSYLQSLIAYLVWSEPKEMTTQDIERVISQFVDTARLMADAGFSGIELHGAHGYLIDQFLNGKTNFRTDAYGGTPEKRARFILEILSQTRKVVPATFAIGIKLNSADHSSATFEETMAQIALLAEAGIDFMEISGGSYEDPKMMGYGKAIAAAEPKSSRTAAREAFFLEFSKEVRQRHPGLVLMLTGGFRTRAGAEAAIRDNACDFVGIGRPAAIDPRFPRVLLDESVGDDEAQMPLNKAPVPWYTRFLPLQLIGAGAESMYYAAQIQRLGKGIVAIAPPW
ncbi:Aldolase-type TIM barrel [Penicillium fimorum]|uniref:Aldolase-type TIM barrel n=1 Tax=Penicillium fimorum TaxID=1882269 RepID=A0A9X0C5M8_9EURO|nr:Aldolase-type TIM barrel [Penicillium fimorum]